MKNNLKTHTAAMAMLLSAGILSVPAGVQASPVLNVTNFIGAPTNFNGFESIPQDSDGYYAGGVGPYDEDGIRVTQSDIFTKIYVNTPFNAFFYLHYLDWKVLIAGFPLLLIMDIRLSRLLVARRYPVFH